MAIPDQNAARAAQGRCAVRDEEGAAIDVDTPDVDVDLPEVDVGINEKGNPDVDVTTTSMST